MWDSNWQNHVTTSEGLFRPAEVDHLVADASRAREELAWSPIMDFEALIHMMVDADLEQAGTGLRLDFLDDGR